MSHKIYSIESRKGGVGKTTVALNLASILVKRGPVLLLDCDITGTSIVDPAKNSSFWSEETHVLTYADKKGKVKDVNLIEYFLEFFIKGEGNVRDIIRAGKLLTSKVNVIGSFLYGTPQEAAIHSSWLMDELHSYWMVEFIQQIIKEFEGVFADKTVHIIVDNSPGYTSFSQSLHDYMYEEGPKNAKFLLVSTLDSQDLQANMEAASEISKNITNRTKVANYYKMKEDDEEDIKRDEDVETLIESNGDVKDFFFNLIDNKQLLEIYLNEYKSEDYLSLVLNKVPQSLQDDKTIVAYNDIVGSEMIDLMLRISGSTDRNRPQNVVYYDEAIVYQYYLKYLRGRYGERPVDAAYWSKRMRELRQQAAEASTLSPMAAMTKLNASYEGLQSSLNKYGYAQIARQLARTWAPDYAIDSMKTRMTRIAMRRLYGAYEIPQQKMKEMLYVWNQEQLRELQSEMGEHTADYVIIADLMEYLSAFAGVNNEKRRPELMITVSLILYVFRMSFFRWDVFEKSLKLFSWQQIMEYTHSTFLRDIFEKPVVVNEELTLNVESIQRMFRTDFTRLYSDFCYTILRLIDQHEDFLFLLDAVELYVPSVPPIPFSKEMTDYISEVIYRKRLERNTSVLVDIRAKSYFMKNMQDVLRENVLKAWK